MLMNVEAKTDSERVVLQFLATLSAGDLEGVRRMLHEEATWTPQMRSVPGAGVHRGPGGIVDDFLKPIRGLFRPGDPKIFVDTIASRGPLVMVETHSGGCLADGRPYANLYAWAVEVRDGKVHALREYFDSHYVVELMAAGSAR
jgi:ketosteroid isomerase-like protein